jgi:hypothetical protein
VILRVSRERDGVIRSDSERLSDVIAEFFSVIGSLVTNASFGRCACRKLGLRNLLSGTMMLGAAERLIHSDSKVDSE